MIDIMKRLKARYGDIRIVQGECKGADLMAKQAAEECGLECIGYPAEWEKYGKNAGPIRNQRMIDEGRPDMGIAFHSCIQNSKGTKDMVTRLRLAKIETFLIK